MPAQPGGSPRRWRGGLAGIVLAGVVAVFMVALASGLFGGWVATQLTADDTPVSGSGGQPAAQLDRSSLAGVVAEVQPAVVSIQTGESEGSGVVLDQEGHILTNAHVVGAAADGAAEVTFSDGDVTTADVVGADTRSDLAVVKVDADGDLVPASFGDSDSVEVGDSVLALGSPLGLEGSVTSGIVSAKNRTIQVGQEPGQPGEPGQPPAAASISGMIQTDAPINPGNSGGALTNVDGDVVGINSAIATAGGPGNVGVGFAIPANTAALVAEQLIAGEQVAHPYVGVSVTDASGGGALVQSVSPDGPAGDAGLRPGDVVTELSGEPVRGADDLVAAVQRSSVGAELAVAFTRDGQPQQATVTVGEAPAD